MAANRPQSETTDNEAIQNLRDTLIKHAHTIEESNRGTSELNKTMFHLTIVGVILSLVQAIAAVITIVKYSP